MNSLVAGSFRLFQVAGITVFLHWSWFIVAYLIIFDQTNRSDEALHRYDAFGWNVAEYLMLFGIVLLHEFGHALACRQVGGRADTIVLWPLGGVAYVAPPPRPGAVLWSIAAGPLVNVALLPVTFGLLWVSVSGGWAEQNLDLVRFLHNVAFINLLLLCFNLLPIYPLDGGQIVQALLWFFLGRARSLRVVSILGMLAGGAVLGLLWLSRADLDSIPWWGILLALFIAWRSFMGFRLAGVLSRPGIDQLEQALSHMQNRRYPEAAAACTRALEVIQDNPPLQAAVLANRGVARLALGELDPAIADLSESIRLHPEAASHNQRGNAFFQKREFEAAIADWTDVLRLDPDDLAALYKRGLAYARNHQYAAAIADLSELQRVQPPPVGPANDLAWLWATCPRDDLRNGQRAVQLATRVCTASDWKDPEHLGTLAAAYAETGDFAAAVKWQKQALEAAAVTPEQVAKGSQRLKRYEEGQPWREE